MLLATTKKILKWVGFSLLGLFLLILIIPELFEDQIAEIVKKEANIYLKAQLEFEDLDISMIRNFPRISVALGDVTIVGRNEFEADTLLVAGEVGAAINLLSIFGENYEISKILVEDTRINAILGRSGAANWDIVKTDEELRAEGYDIDESEVPLALELEDIDIANLSLSYDDRDANMYVLLENLTAECSGNINGDITNLEVVGGSPSLTVTMMGVPIIEDIALNVDMDTEIDMANMKFTFRENVVRLNAIETGIDGWVAMLEDGFDMDLRLNTEKVSFKNLLSLLPGMYSSDFQKLNASGNVMLSAYARGLFNEQSVPAFDVMLSVSDAKFKYPELPAGVDNINVVAKVANPGGSADATTIKINPFTLQMAGQTLSMTADIATPISDMSFDMGLRGELNLGKLKDIYPIEGTTLAGNVSADMQLKGRASYLTQGGLDKCVASGTISLTEFAMGGADAMSITIPASTFTFTPAALRLSDTKVVVGGSDLTLSASLENYLGYLFADSTIKGTVNINSDTINLDELLAMVGEEPAAEPVAEPVESQEEVISRVEAVRVPANIDFNMKLNAKQIIMGKMNLRNLLGTLVVKDSKIDVRNLSINTMGGGIALNGLYSTPSDYKALFGAGVNVNSLKFADIARDLGIESKLMSSIQGVVSSSFNIDAPLNGTTPDLGALTASGSLSVKGLGLPQMEIFSMAADLLGDDRLKNPKVEDFAIGFAIKDGVFSTKPVDIKISGYVVHLEGYAKLDQTIDYKGTITAPSGKLAAMGPIPLTVKGTITKPELMVDMESIAKSAAQQVLSGLTGKRDEAKGEESGADSALQHLSPEVAEKVQKADSVANSVKTAIDNLPTKEEMVEQLQEQLPTKEEIVEGAKEQLKGAALDFLKGLGNK